MTARHTQQQFHQPLRYQGQYFDAETGLHYNRFRFYVRMLGGLSGRTHQGSRAG
ncbi:RHS repeat-associated core domain-containing protein [Cronobacter dublinensis]|nr:RHS repeat-associated core domain-containing protein [Cronobacter dublinensis]MDI6443140.1 RHS repeat-associated core domain-containing protein [Cronobacter dublinensis]